MPVLLQEFLSLTKLKQDEVSSFGSQIVLTFFSLLSWLSQLFLIFRGICLVIQFFMLSGSFSSTLDGPSNFVMDITICSLLKL